LSLETSSTPQQPKPSDLETLLQAEKELLAHKQRLREELPHLYGYPWYKWAHEYFESRNRMNFLLAGNQLSKSSTQIRKAIHWATEPRLWSELWLKTPRQFWYLYPDKTTLTIEFETKWESDFLPRGSMKTHSKYGWDVEYKDKAPFCLTFNSGMRVFFRTFSQKVSNIQGGTVDAVFVDEELPEEFLNELLMRMSATSGYFHMCFTATLGQDIWKKTMEPDSGSDEKYPGAFKRQVSLFDCMHYMDGSPSPWTMERINSQISLCSTEAEVQKRIYGKFIIVGGRTYEAFQRKTNVKELPADLKVILREWHIYGGADSGSGGDDNHPAGIVFVAVRPDYRKGVVFRAWRGDGVVTTSSDVVQKFLELQGTLKMHRRVYDQSDKDFDTIATGLGEPFEKSEKNHEIGEKLLNDLFKHDILSLMEGDSEIEKLASELSTLKKSTPKRHAKDDLADPLRYTCLSIPWDLSVITGELSAEEQETIKRKASETLSEEDLRRQGTGRMSVDEEQELLLRAEFDEWNHLLEGGY
jgi:phage terminase large subunit-like protein